jgi:hypothetical protein
VGNENYPRSHHVTALIPITPIPQLGGVLRCHVSGTHSMRHLCKMGYTDFALALVVRLILAQFLSVAH